MLNKGDICPICGSEKISEKVITGRFKYKGHLIRIPDYHVFECDSCTEKIVSNKTLKENEKTLTDFRRKVDGLLTSDEIRAIREKLGKTQTEMANLIGVGEKNFARYENGQVTQSKTMDWLLRILDDDPHIFQKIKKETEMDYEVIKELSVECPIRLSGKGYGQKITKFEYGDEDGEAAYAA